MMMMMRSSTCSTLPNWKHQCFLCFLQTNTLKFPLITTLNVCKMSNSYYMSTTSFVLNKKRRKLAAVYGAKKRRRRKKKANWWDRFFQDYDDEIWSNWSAEDVLAVDEDDDDDESNDSFESWKRKAEAISELREAQEDARNAQGREWEDWLQQVEESSSSSSPSDPTTTTTSSTNSSWDQDQTDFKQPKSSTNNIDDELTQDNYDLVGFIKNNMYSDRDNDDSEYDVDDDDELLFEDRVFQFASTSSAKFVALLILIPWVIDFLVHDYVLMPFLDRYVKTVPLAAEMLDVRRSQKLEIVKSLKVEKGRFRLEMEIGKSPPLSDEELWLELRHKAIELRDEWRLENRRAFANIWSDMLYGISLFVLIYSNKNKVALLKFTGYKLINNVSDTGKAFLIILITDIFLGYHSESGWQALVEIILEHYGLEADPAAITVFICFVPVVIDACVKLWLFKYLPRLSPNVTNIFREMKRH